MALLDQLNKQTDWRKSTLGEEFAISLEIEYFRSLAYDK